MQAMDAGQNFLTGQITSAFSASGLELTGSTVFELASNLQNQAQQQAEALQNTAMTLVSSAGAGLGTTFGTVVGAGLALSGQVAQVSDLLQQAAMDVGKHSLEKVQSKISEIATTTTSYMTQRASYWSKSILQSELATIPNKFLEDGASKALKEVTEMKGNALGKVMDYVNTYTGKVTEIVNKFTSYMQQYGDDISTFAAQGPQWVVEKISKVKEDAIEEIDKFVDDQAQSIMDARNKLLDGAAQSVAKSLVQPSIDAANKKINDATNQLNKSKKTIMQKAATQIQKAKYKLAGMLGIAPL